MVFNSLSQSNLVHKLILVNQAMKILDAKAAHDRKWEEPEQFPASSVTKFKNKKEVIEHAQKKERQFLFATLMYLCHFKWSRRSKHAKGAS